MDKTCALPAASASIFSGTLRHSTTCGPGRDLRAPTIPQSQPASVSVALAVLDAELTAILDAPLMLGETVMLGYARKEVALARAFARLTLLDARALHARFTSPRSDDAIAAKFGRLTAERRGRLLDFLADARWRAARAPRPA